MNKMESGPKGLMVYRYQEKPSETRSDQRVVSNLEAIERAKLNFFNKIYTMTFTSHQFMDLYTIELSALLSQRDNS